MGTLLTWMSEKTAPCFVVATANDISKLPPELLRRGRFDEIFFLDLPSMTERCDILAVHIRRSGRDPAAYDLATVAAATEGLVGAELAQVVLDGLVHAFDAGRDLTTDDLLTCAGTVVPLSVSQRERVSALRAWLAEGRAQPASSGR
jgi:SpoVK/Ycf46/Vps4 family AAA+-type ATPase